MAAPNEPDDKLLEAIQSGRVQPDSSDPSLAKALAAHQKLEALFELLRRPVQQEQKDVVTVGTAVGTPSSSGVRFRILRPHAKGGLGEVFVAHDEELHREVALKEIQARHADNLESRARFIQEAEITGKLEHPGIVPVYGLARYPDGRPFYAMRLVQGEMLTEAIWHIHERFERRTRSDVFIEYNKQLRQLIQVCNALAFAHSRGIIHRDLKPDNIMLGAFGEVYVVDWGLAKPFNQAAAANCQNTEALVPVSASESTPTRMGSVVGTPQFMSPEQAAGALHQLGPASDIYSLGATLYCMLTNKSPFPDPREIGIQELLHQIQRGEFLPPRQVGDAIPSPLEDICLKAMALHPENRYRSASEMALDIENYLDHKPVFASADIKRIRLLGQLKVSIVRNQKLAFERSVSEPVQLGRQRADEEAPYSTKVDKGRLRLIISPQGDSTVSETHAVLEPLECGRVRLVNLSLRLPIKLAGGHDLLTDAAVNLALPVKFSLGSNVIELNWVEKRLDQPATSPASRAPVTPATMAVCPEPISIQRHRALKAGIAVWVLVAIVSLSINLILRDNPQLLANLQETLLGLGVCLTLLCFLPMLWRMQAEANRRALAEQAEEDQRALAKFGLGKRPQFLRDWLVLNTAVWAAITLGFAVFNHGRLDPKGVAMVWLVLLLVTVGVPIRRLFRWRRLARLQATLPNRLGPKCEQSAACSAGLDALSSDVQAQASDSAAPSGGKARGC
jgi:serine/threonine protein kinase